MNKYLLSIILLFVSTISLVDNARASSCDGVGMSLGTSLESKLQLSSNPNAPLIVVFHGKNGCIGEVQQQSTLDTDQQGMSVLWLTGKNGVWDGWYDGAQVTYSYIEEALQATYATGASPATVVAVGISMGAVMAMWAACTLPDFNGAVTIAGTGKLAKCAHKDLSLMVIGGSLDNSTTPPSSLMPPALVDRWCLLSATCGDPVTLNIDNGELTVIGCANGALIQQVVLYNAGHIWPLLPNWNTDIEISKFVKKIGFSIPLVV